MLYVVSTPIGNLEDITLRAVRVLREVDRVACEDTRVTRKLLDHHGISAKTMRHEAHNEAASTQGILDLLGKGVSVALVSDAGTPGVADPGERLVSAAIDAGHQVVAVPGPSAGLTALVASGLPTQPHTFHGFLIKGARQRAAQLEGLAPGTHVFFCPARDLRQVADAVSAVHPEARVAIGRELTKRHETWYRGSPDQARDLLDGDDAQRGEAVLVLHLAAQVQEATDQDIAEALQPLLREGMRRKDAAGQVARSLTVSARHVYAIAVDLEVDEEGRS